MVVLKLSTISQFRSCSKIILSIQGISMTSERIFSTTGIIVNKQRSRLWSDGIDQIELKLKRKDCLIWWKWQCSNTLEKQTIFPWYLMHFYSILYMCITTFSFLIKMFSLNHTNKLTYFKSFCTQNKTKKICFQNVISDTINRLISRNVMRLTDEQFCNRFLCDLFFS